MIKKTSENLIKIIKILNNKDYHDGTTLGKELNISRAAVWKIIKKLQAFGVDIKSVKGLGYILKDDLTLLNEDIIKSKFDDKLELEIFEQIDSTNDYLKQFKGATKPRVCLAEHQTLGKGRFNRKWHSPFGKNIYFSCLYPFNKDISELAGLSLVVSLVIIKTLSELDISDDLKVKWSNDIIHKGSKISGNLIEIQAEANTSCSAIIGIGLNVNMLHDDDLISQEWTSVYNILGRTFDRNIIVQTLIKNLFTYMDAFNEKGFPFFIEEWKRYDLLKGNEVSLSFIGKAIKGISLGVSDKGYLILKLDDGEVKHFSSGEVSKAIPPS